MKTTLLFFAMLIGLAVQAQNDKIVGRWTGDDLGESITLVFDAEGYCSIVSATETVGGPNMDLDGYAGYMVYEVAYEDPLHKIDLNVYLRDGDEFLGGMPGIFTLDGDKMHICLNFEGSERPTAFIEEDSLWLTKE